MNRYILTDSGEIQQVHDLEQWAKWIETNNSKRIVAKTRVNTGVEVSTIFLGLDHQFGDGPPLLFETLVFGGQYDQEQWRWSTRTQAISEHDQIVMAVRQCEAPEGGDLR